MSRRRVPRLGDRTLRERFQLAIAYAHRDCHTCDQVLESLRYHLEDPHGRGR